MDGKLTLQEKAVEAAARFLRIRGYEMLATEWRPHEAKGAIDLVARDPESDELVFVDLGADELGAVGDDVAQQDAAVLRMARG